jgi:hypothetical protein
MGFRDFTCFNKALLAKQIWRIWKTPDSLTARIMKGKYFPNCSVLEATLGKKTIFCVEEYTELEWNYSGRPCVEGGKWSEDTNLGRQVAAHSKYI